MSGVYPMPGVNMPALPFLHECALSVLESLISVSESVRKALSADKAVVAWSRR